MSCFARWLRISLRLILLVALPLVFVVPSQTRAQVEPLGREQATIIPPHNVLSVRTDAIRAQAQYLQASGDFMVSAAVARRHHALAAREEIRNHAEWVKTYFELKDLNKAWNLKEHPPFIDRAEKRAKQLERAIIDNPQLTLEGDVREGRLNWLLDRIATTALAAQALTDSNQVVSFLGRPDSTGPSSTPQDSAVDQTLTRPELKHIVLTDGAHAGGRKMIFRADEAKVLDTPWPFDLRGPEFDVARREFELARDNAVKEVTETGTMSFATQLALKQAVDELMVAFKREYPRKRRHASSDDWSDYAQGNRFLQSLALGVRRAIDTNDKQVFDGSYRFRGGSVIELIQHMCRHGLEFGAPAPGDEGVYTKLFLATREIYVDAREANQQANKTARPK